MCSFRGSRKHFQMTNIPLPPGLIDENIELFSQENKAMALFKGRVVSLFELPLPILRIITEELVSNEPAFLALQLAGYETLDKQLEKFTVCRFGSFDHLPDYSQGQLAKSEYHDCGYRGECSMEGIVCSSLWVNGRVVSPFETRMIQLLASEDVLPVVAEKLQISLTNFETRKKVLFEKLGVATRAGMVSAAYKIGVLKPSCSA